MIISKTEYNIAKNRSKRDKVTWKNLRTGEVYTWFVDEILSNVDQGLIKVDMRIEDRRK